MPVEHLARVPHFDATTKVTAKDVKLADVAAKQTPVQDLVARTLKALDAPDGHLYGGSFRMKAADLTKALKDPESAKKLAYDAIVASGDTFLGEIGKFDPSFEDMTVVDVKMGDAEATAEQIMHHYIIRGERPLEFNGMVSTIAKSLKAEPATRYVKASWDNNDDTDAQALIAINERSGSMRVIVGNNQP